MKAGPLQQERAAEKPARSDPNALGAGWFPSTQKLSWVRKTSGALMSREERMLIKKYVQEYLALSPNRPF